MKRWIPILFSTQFYLVVGKGKSRWVPLQRRGKKKSIHLEKFLDFPKKFENLELNNKWAQLIKIRNICNLSIEEKRTKKEIGSSLEASLEIKIDKKLFKISQNTDFAELCITSHAEIMEHKEESVKVNTTKAKGDKCPVCWKIKEGKCSRHSFPIV